MIVSALAFYLQCRRVIYISWGRSVTLQDLNRRFLQLELLDLPTRCLGETLRGGHEEDVFRNYSLPVSSVLRIVVASEGKERSPFLPFPVTYLGDCLASHGHISEFHPRTVSLRYLSLV